MKTTAKTWTENFYGAEERVNFFGSIRMPKNAQCKCCCCNTGGFCMS